MAGLRVLPALTRDLPRLDEVAVNGRVLLFIGAITVVTALFSGLPQWRRTRATTIEAAGGLALRTTASAEKHALQDAIVIAQVALAVVLLAGSSLLVRSYLHLRATDPGFDPRGVLVAPIFLDAQACSSATRPEPITKRLRSACRRFPGERCWRRDYRADQPARSGLPASGLARRTSIDPSQQTVAFMRMANAGYFPVMKLRVTEGRPFDDRDQPASPLVVMISETLARRLWPGQSAVGRRLVVDYSTAGTYPTRSSGSSATCDSADRAAGRSPRSTWRTRSGRI